MGAGAEVGKLTLLIEADDGVFRQVLNQLNLVRLALFLHQCDCLSTGQLKTFERQCFFNDLLHLSFNLGQIVSGDGGLGIYVVVEAVGNRRTDCQLDFRPEAFDRLCHDVGSGMAQGRQAFLVLCGQDVEGAVMVNDGTQVDGFAVHLCDSSDTGKAGADILRNFDSGKSVLVFFYRAVFQGYFNHCEPSFH